MGITWGIFYLIFLGMCIFQMCQFGRVETRELDSRPAPQKVYVTVQVSDSTVDSETMATLDSIARIMKEWNEYCDENLLHGLNDLRQETNNVIEKQNGWFSFWLGILALVGALLPVIIQIKVQDNQSHVFKSELEAAIQDVEREKQAIRSELELVKQGVEREKEKIQLECKKSKMDLEQEKQSYASELETIKEEIGKEKENVNQEIDNCVRQRSEMEQFRLLHEISNLSFMLITCKENRWGKNSIDRDQSWNDLLDEIVRKTQQFIHVVTETDDLYHENIPNIKMVLLQLHAVYSVYIPTAVKSYTSRKLLKITHELGDVFENLSKNVYATRQGFQEVWNALRTMMNAVKL